MKKNGFQHSVIGFLMIFFMFSCNNNDETILEFSDYDWQLEEINDFNNEVFIPINIWFDRNGKLVIHDSGDQEHPIKILPEGMVMNTIPSGRGPGEVEYVLRKFFSERKNERYIFDAAQKRMLLFDEEYAYIEDVDDVHINEGVYIAGVYSDSLVFTVSMDYILQIHTFGDTSEKQNVRFTLHDSDYEFLDPLREGFAEPGFLVKIKARGILKPQHSYSIRGF